MKKNGLYVIIAAVLLIIAGVLYFKDKQGTLHVDRKAFAISDTANIAKVSIRSNTESLFFERRDQRWYVNGMYIVKERSLNALLGTLMNFEVTAPVPKSNLSMVLAKLHNDPITVEIISFDNKVLKKYYVADGDSLHTGSYMLLDGQDKPYVVHLPGFDSRLSMIFNTDPFIWRDRVAFSYQPGQILSVEINYPAQKEASFTLNARSGNQLEVQSTATKAVKKISQDEARTFLMNFAQIPFDWIYTGGLRAISDSLSHQTPFCEIRIKDINNKINLLRTYRIPVAKGVGSFNMDRMYAFQQNDSIPVFVKFVSLDPILKTFSDFHGQ